MRLRLYILFLFLTMLSGASGWACTKKTHPSASAKKNAVVSQQEVALTQEHRYYFYAALQAVQESKYDEAMALFLHCEELAPDDPVTKHYLSILYNGLGDSERAQHYAEASYRLCPTEYWQYLIQVFQQGDPKRAINEMEHVAKQMPDDTDVLETLQRMYSAQDDIRGALKVQDRLDKVAGPTPYGTMQRFTLLNALGKHKQAEDAIQNYLKEDPSNYYFQVFLGDNYLHEGRRQDAFRQYQKIQATYPENPYLDLSLANYYGTAGQSDSAAFFQQQAIDNSQVGLDYKLTLLNDYPWLKADSLQEKALLSLVQQYPSEAAAPYRLAQFYISHQRSPEAEPLLWTVLDITPNNDAAWQALLEIYRSDTAVTQADYQRLVSSALKQRPEQKQWYFLMAQIQVANDQLDSAIYYCTTGLQQPEEKDLQWKFSLYVQMADVYMLQHQPDSAYNYYELALGIDPENIYVLNNYAYFLAINGGDLRKAEKMSARVIKVQPNEATYLDTYAWILHLQGQETLARFYMQRAWDNAGEEARKDGDLLEHYNILLKQ